MLGARGKKVLVLHRIVKNDRMAAVGYLWSFAALRLSTGARDTTIGAALPVTDMPPLNAKLFNRFLGCLYLSGGKT